ncbi:MAG: hypothetical protein KDB06_15315 [Ilumatobacter sp.]|nr:hypothetical protein [Ilumatobacter sp.]
MTDDAGASGINETVAPEFDLASDEAAEGAAAAAVPVVMVEYAEVSPAPLEPAKPPAPDPTTKVGRLVANVTDALMALPTYWQTQTTIEGIEAGDLFGLNGALGGTIEINVVATLNRIRKVWDPNDEWPGYGFVRNSQSFPDVRLVGYEAGELVNAFGIELKGWYLLAKEGEPSFRYKVCPEACEEHDLLVIVPWHLSNVLAGQPTIHEPFIGNARWLAEMRNHWWLYQRQSTGTRRLKRPQPLPAPYSPPRSKTSDEGVNDSGRNFGRVSRVNVMNDYLKAMLLTQVSGVDANAWRNFFITNTKAGRAAVSAATLEIELASKKVKRETAEEARDLLSRILDLLRP